eukprot:CCRYP_004799-RA/>CCRYP_004799-RA protein AED:0.27 eAED:0.27 QI:173/1/1/1/0/0/2/242/280
MSDRPLGPLGIDPLTFSASLFGLLFLFVLYLLLPRGVRVQYFGAYPKRYAWSARTRGGRMRKKSGGESLFGGSSISSARVAARPTGRAPSNPRAMAPGDNTADPNNNSRHLDFNTPSTNQEDIVVSAAMQQLRDPGVLIVAHGSRGKPKTVRLVLTENAITWRTEMRKKSVAGGNKELKLGKLHQVPLSHIMYVDIGKQTTALRRVENAAVSEALCFSLLTKEGSLDLEANSPRERDALVQCFSLVLDEVHAQNWRDIYRGPSSDMPSSFDEGDGGIGGL